MGCFLAGAILNLILDSIYIFVLGWGIRGTAIATVTSRVLSAVMVLVCLSGLAFSPSLDSTRAPLSAAGQKRPFGKRLAAALQYDLATGHREGVAALHSPPAAASPDPYFLPHLGNGRHFIRKPRFSADHANWISRELWRTKMNKKQTNTLLLAASVGLDAVGIVFLLAAMFGAEKRNWVLASALFCILISNLFAIIHMQRNK